MDWGVEDQEEDIYQTPVMDAQPPGGIKKSETTGDIAGGGVYADFCGHSL